MRTCLLSLFCAFPFLVLGNNSFTLTGQIRNWDQREDQEVSTLNFYLNNILAGEQEEIRVEVDAEGKFEAQGEIIEFLDISLAFDNWIEFWVAPGAEVHLEFDALDDFRTIQFSKDFAKLNNQLMKWHLAQNELWKKEFQKDSYSEASELFYQTYRELKGGHFQSFSNFLSGFGQKRLAFLESFQLEVSVSDTVITWARNSIIGNTLNNWSSFKGASKMDSVEYFHEKMKAQFPLHTIKFISSENHFNLGNYRAFLTQLIHKGYYETSSQEKLKWMLEEGAPQISSELTSQINSLLAQGEKADPEQMDTLTKKLAETYEEYWAQKGLSAYFLELCRITDQNFEKETREFLYTWLLGECLTNVAFPQFDAIWPKYMSLNPNPLYKEGLQEKYKAIKTALDAGISEGINLNEFPEKGTEDMIGDLVKKHPGKVLYIDLWATWCGPCIGTFPQAKTLKEDLKGEEVVFVYLAASSSNPKKWKNVIQSMDLKGEHYFMDDPSYEAFLDQFNIPSIPRYLLVDKTGKVVDSNAPRPNQAYKKILRLTKKG